MMTSFRLSPRLRTGRVLTIATACAFACASESSAQTYDHLQCFKIRDVKTFSAASVDLDALLVQFGMQSCTIKGRAKKFCVPADKTVTSIEDGSVIPDTSEDLTLARLCYKLRCPATTAGAMTVSDQFGSRTVDSFKAVELCTPAVQGPPPTVTTTSISTTSTTMEESLDDTFDGPGLDPSWTVLNSGLVSVSVMGGALHWRARNGDAVAAKIAGVDLQVDNMTFTKSALKR